MSNPKRGEIYWLNFSPATGVEMRDPHPALVIQNDVANEVSSLTLVAAITSTAKVARLPVGIPIEPEESGLPQISVVHLGHIYTVDKQRINRKIGVLSDKKMREIDRAISISLGIVPFDQM